MTDLQELDAALGRIDNVWEMSPALVEYAYRHRHLNTYVYAALLVAKTSSWPREGRFRLRRGLYDSRVENIVDQILALLPAIRSGADPRRTRLALTQLLNELYVALPRLSLPEVPSHMSLLAALVFISLAADRADSIPLWFHPPVRVMDRDMLRRFQHTLEPFDFEALSDGPHAEELIKRGVQFDIPESVVTAATILFVQAIIFAVENGKKPETVRRAYQNVEQAMRRFETSHGLHLGPGECLDARRAGLLRYRNTLYLYGGNHLERMGDTSEAKRWYLREIDTPELPEFLRFYLTGLKTTERLLRAHTVAQNPLRPFLRRLIERSLVVCQLRARHYCAEVLETRRSAPGIDWSWPRVQTGSKLLFFGGEATREPLLAALIYCRVVQGVRYANTDYSIFERID